MKKTKGKSRNAPRNFGINIIAVDDKGKSLGFELESPGKKEKITSSRLLPEDFKIQLKMLFPEKQDLNLIKANGTVKWVKQVKRPDGKYFIVGVHFREASAREKAKITKLWKTHRS
jgi:hypothetical protein